MTRLKIARRAFLIAAASLCVALAAAAPARAQSQDDLFDPDTIQELRLTINSRDLRDLRTNFEKDTVLHGRPAVAQHSACAAPACDRAATRAATRLKLGLRSTSTAT